MNINNISDMLLGDEIGSVQEDETGKKKTSAKLSGVQSSVHLLPPWQ